MIKFGVLIDDDPVKEYLNQLTGEKPFEISGFYKQKEKPGIEPALIPVGKRFNSFDELLEKSDAILFLGGNYPDAEKVIRATKRFKHIFLSEALNIDDSSYYKMLKLAQEASIVVSFGNPLLYNTAFLSLSSEIIRPAHIEIRRKNKPESKSDNNIARVLIKDFEFLLSVVNANPKKIVQGGIGEHSDIPTMINTRIEFDNGCSASLIYNYLHDEEKHYLHIYQKAKHFFIDFLNLETKIYQLENRSDNPNKMDCNNPYVRTRKSDLDSINPYRAEIMAFYNSLSGRTEPMVSFEKSLEALELANKVMDRLLVSKDQIAL